MSAVAQAPGQRRAAAIIIGYALREAARRRVLVVVAALTVAFLVLYALGAAFAFEEAGEFGGGFTDGIDDRTLTGATLQGLAMFATLFLGAIIATFLTMGVVRGDAETGMLQPLVARPANRATILVARTAGAAVVSFSYVVVVYALTVAITAATGDWTPDRPLGRRPAARPRGGGGHVHLDARLGLAHRHGPGDRRADDLRRWDHGRPARPDRRRAGLGARSRTSPS